MKFWDSSALVPLFVAEAASARVRAATLEDPEVAVWALSRVEIVSAIHRRWRKEPTAQRQVDAALRELARTSIDWFEVIDVRSARVRAEHILKIHALRAADALQLGAALIAADGEPARLPFVTLDRRLASAAEREGFPVTALS